MIKTRFKKPDNKNIKAMQSESKLENNDLTGYYWMKN